MLKYNFNDMKTFLNNYNVFIGNMHTLIDKYKTTVNEINLNWVGEANDSFKCSTEKYINDFDKMLNELEKLYDLLCEEFKKYSNIENYLSNIKI